MMPGRDFSADLFGGSGKDFSADLFGKPSGAMEVAGAPSKLPQAPSEDIEIAQPAPRSSYVDQLLTGGLPSTYSPGYMPPRAAEQAGKAVVAGVGTALTELGPGTQAIINRIARATAGAASKYEDIKKDVKKKGYEFASGRPLTEAESGLLKAETEQAKAPLESFKQTTKDLQQHYEGVVKKWEEKLPDSPGGKFTGRMVGKFAQIAAFSATDPAIAATIIPGAMGMDAGVQAYDRTLEETGSHDKAIKMALGSGAINTALMAMGVPGIKGGGNVINEYLKALLIKAPILSTVQTGADAALNKLVLDKNMSVSDALQYWLENYKNFAAFEALGTTTHIPAIRAEKAFSQRLDAIKDRFTDLHDAKSGLVMDAMAAMDSLQKTNDPKFAYALQESRNDLRAIEQAEKTGRKVKWRGQEGPSGKPMPGSIAEEVSRQPLEGEPTGTIQPGSIAAEIEGPAHTRESLLKLSAKKGGIKKLKEVASEMGLEFDPSDKKSYIIDQILQAQEIRPLEQYTPAQAQLMRPVEPGGMRPTREQMLKDIQQYLPEGKGEIKLKGEPYADEEGKFQEDNLREYQGRGEVREGEGIVREPEGITRETATIDQGGGLPVGGEGQKEAINKWREKTDASDGMPWHELPPGEQSRISRDMLESSQRRANNSEETVSDFRAIPDTRDGRIIGGDLVNLLHKAYQDNPNHGLGALSGGDVEPLVNNMLALKHVRDAAIERASKEGKEAVVMVGGQGAGKTTLANTLIDKNPETIGLVVDQPHNDPAALEKIVRKLREKGLPVNVIFVDRDAAEAFRSTLSRSKTEVRYVNPDAWVAATHEAPKAAEHIGLTFRNDPNVSLFHKTKDSMIGGSLDAEGKDALLSIRDMPPTTKEDLDAIARRVYLEEKGAGNVPSATAKSIERSTPVFAEDTGRVGEPIQGSPGAGGETEYGYRAGLEAPEVQPGIRETQKIPLDKIQAKQNIAITADFMGLQQAYEKGFEIARNKLGLQPEATAVEVARAIGERLGKLGTTVKETAVKILAKIGNIGREFALKIAEIMHHPGFDDWRRSQEGVVKIGPPRPRPTTKEIAQEPAGKIAEDKVRELFPGEGNKALRKALYDTGIHRQTDSEIAIKRAAQELSGRTQDRTGNSMRQFVKKIKGTFKPIQQLAAPSTMSPSSQRMADIESWGRSVGAQKLTVVRNAILPALKMLDKAPERLQNLVVDAIENPSLRNSIKDKTLRQFSDNLKDLQDSLWDAIKARGGEMGYEDNYIHHTFENPKEAIEVIRKARMEGNLGYMKERKGPETYALARELGLKPKEPNAARIVLEDAANKIKYIYTHDILTKAREEGLILEGTKKKGKDGKVHEEAPEGMVALPRDVSTTMARTAVDKQKTYYTYPEVAKIITNHLNPGFEGNAIYELPRLLNNTMNQVELGLSAFHGAVISNEIAASMIGIGTKRALQGELGTGLKDIATGLTPVLAQVKVFKEGTKLIKALESGKPIPDAMGGEGFQKYFNLGGARTRMDAEYVNNNIDKLRQAWGRMSDSERSKLSRMLGGAQIAKEIPFSAIEAAMKPIMEYYVPRAKIAVFKRMYDSVKDYIPEGVSEDQLARRARRDWDQIENAFGQLTYDNLHWNKAFKQSLMLALRAVGWKLGSKRAIYGGMYDLGKMVKMSAVDIANKMGVPWVQKEAMRQHEAKMDRGDFEPSNMTQRAAWVLGQATITSLIGASVMGIRAAIKKSKGEELTKEDIPSGLDWTYPRTGERDVFGKEKRIASASYVKEGIDDYLAWRDLFLHRDPSGIKEVVEGAESPLAHWGTELITGKDWKGNPIESHTSNLAKKFLPIPVAKYVSEREKGQTGQGAIKEAAIGAMGLMRPKAAHLQTEAERKVYKLWAEKYKTSETSESQDERSKAKGLAERHMKGEDVSEEVKGLSPMAQKKYAKEQLPSNKMMFMVKRFNYNDLKDVYSNYANKEEKLKLYELLPSAFRRHLNSVPINKRDEAIAEYNRFRKEESPYRSGK